MKKFVVPFIALGFATGAFADSATGWSIPVRYVETTFGCKGLTPDLTVSPGVNVSAGPHGEFRVQLEGASHFSLVGEELNFLTTGENGTQSVTLGTLGSKPNCTIEDAGEPATADWVAINMSSQLTLTFTPNVSSCHPAERSSTGFIRTNQLTLSIVGSNGKELVTSWQDDAYYHSKSDCQNANW